MLERFCVRDKVPIPPDRVKRGSVFCSAECRRLDKIERRKEKAGKSCRLCGRALPSKKTARGMGQSLPTEIRPCATVAHTPDRFVSLSQAEISTLDSPVQNCGT
jgi:hypothetical protein